MKHIILTFIFISFLTVNGRAQKKKNYFPIWSYHQKNSNIYGLSVGLGSFFEPSYTNSNGIKIELIGAGILAPLVPGDPTVSSDSAFVALMESTVSERINGINISVGGSACDCKINGLSVGLIGHLIRQTNGISAALIMNYTQAHNGLQIAGFNGSYKMTGVQIGISNNATKSSGVQLGLFNSSESHKGFQFGLWNENQKRKFPLINWSFKK